jgi:hypothetical protein
VRSVSLPWSATSSLGMKSTQEVTYGVLNWVCSGRQRSTSVLAAYEHRAVNRGHRGDLPKCPAASNRWCDRLRSALLDRPRIAKQGSR